MFRAIVLLFDTFFINRKVLGHSLLKCIYQSLEVLIWFFSGATDTNEEKPGTASAASNQPSVGSTQVSSSDEDEDYEEEEDEEGETDEDEEESDEDEYLLAMDGGMEASTPGVDSGTTACVVALFKVNLMLFLNLTNKEHVRNMYVKFLTRHVVL